MRISPAIVERKEEVIHQPQQSPSPGEDAAVEGERTWMPTGACEPGASLGFWASGRPGWTAVQGQLQASLRSGNCACHTDGSRGVRTQGPPSLPKCLARFRLRRRRGAFPWVFKAWEKPTIERTVCCLRARALTLREAQRRQSPRSGCTAQ